jgi:hypothetical protein
MFCPLLKGSLLAEQRRSFNGARGARQAHLGITLVAARRQDHDHGSE